MQKFLTILFSRYTLAIVMIVLIGAFIWFVGPLLAFGGMRPLESVGLRVTIFILILVFVLCLLWSISILAIGVALLCLLIWHAGPLLAIGAMQPLAPIWSRIAVISVILLIYAIYGLYLLLKAAQQNQHILDRFFGKNKNDSDEIDKETLTSLRKIIQSSLNQLKTLQITTTGLRKLLEGKRYLYELPWYLVIGHSNSGKTTALINSGLKFPLGAQMQSAASALAKNEHNTANCDWWFSHEAVLIDTAGRYTEQEPSPKNKAEWMGLLGLLRQYRTRTPINGAIVVVSIGELLAKNDAENMKHASQLRERLLELRRVLGVRFPVYVVITKMDLLAGFSEYFESQTTDTRSQVWGFTLPYTAKKQSLKKQSDNENSANSLEKAISVELTALKQVLDNGLLVRLQEGLDNDLRQSLYQLPQEFAGLIPRLTRFVDSVFQDSRYDNTELHNMLRGVYFTSAAQGNVREVSDKRTLWQRFLNAINAKSEEVNDSEPNSVMSTQSQSTSTKESNEQGVGQSSRKAILGNRSYFLRDLFTKIIVPEAHLARPNLIWEFRFRVIRLVAYSIVIVLSVWLAAGFSVSHENNSKYLNSVAGKTVSLTKQVSTLFAANGEEKLQAIPDVLTAAQELPTYTGLSLESPSSSFRFGLYSGPTVIAASDKVYAYLQDHFLLPQIIRRMESVLELAVRDKDSKTAYDTLRVYLQLHDPKHYNAQDLKTWMQKDLSQPESLAFFGGRTAMTAHIAQLFSAQRVVQSPFVKNEKLVQQTRQFLDGATSMERLYERAKSAMQLEAPQEFTLLRAVGPQAGTVFARASDQPIGKGIDGLFTYDGYHNLFSKRLPEFLAKAQIDDAWVMGYSSPDGTKAAEKNASTLLDSAIDDDELTREIRRQYLNEYAQRWTFFLNDIRTVTGANLAFDLTVLRTFAAPDSPLSRLARAAAKETTLSRSLNTKPELDKNFIDKASEQLTKKSRDVLGLSSKERQERELVDNRFAALREIVTGQADVNSEQSGQTPQGEKLGLENIIGLLNEYYTLLVVADAALNTNSLPPGSIEAGMKLKLEGDKLPAPFKQVLSALAESGSQKIGDGASAIYRAQAQQQVNQINAVLASQVTDVCKRSIEGRYPFSKTSQDVSIDDFNRLFASGGTADDFFQKYLAPYIETSSRPWKYKLPSSVKTSLSSSQSSSIPNVVGLLGNTGPTLDGELIALLTKQGPNPDIFAQIAEIRESYFRGTAGKNVAWKVDMKIAEMDPSIVELIINIDGQVTRYSHGPIQVQTIIWPGSRGGTVAELTALPRIKPDTSSIVTSGAWALLRLLERGKITTSNAGGKAEVEFNLDGRKVVLDFNSGSFSNPLTSNLFANFHCPGNQL